jgi:hypothetical protein
MSATEIRPAAVPASAVLSTWHAYAWRDGVRVDDLAALDRLTVVTRHNMYEIVVVSPETGEVLVRGGAYFPSFTPVRLAGSTLGGSFLKLRSIFVGFNIEFSIDRGVVLTSPVRTIALTAGRGSSDVM